MRRLAILVLLASSVASAQTTAPSLLRFPYLATPPNVAESVWTMFRGSTFYDSAQSCPRFTPDGHNFDPCLATVAQVASAQTAAESTAAAQLSATVGPISSRISALESGSATQTQLASAVSTLNTRIASVEADYMTVAAANSAISTMQASISSNAGGISSLNTRVTALESGTATASSVTALTSRVAALEANGATTTALNSAVATLNARIDGLQKRLCSTATVTGLSVPLAGISTETAISIPGVPVGTSCDTGSSNWMPLGARPDVVVSTAGTARLRFVSNGGLLSVAIAIPSGTYRVCCDM